ncbi:serine/threonine-protein kinase [Nocardia sp. 852002-20019_SCH5090214]|uniref:serine/threonine-protein kinase n=1 Tax=Nocardia sp. 852002-20019_SCH5090214 TaxID=1834087 RepID=UPI001E3E1BB8|nr:serine/threonine-protein kinase [Nocardia sp. 852002-20019_SCH5090214]
MQLSESWFVGDPIGRGGFGHVYHVTGGGREAVAKFVPKEPGADRELLFANPEGVRNIVPIIDSGEHNNYWVLVMPRAERSLRDQLDVEPIFSLADAIKVIGDVCDALSDLDGKVVHRDLKPDNVLLLDGKWCLSDFGISRYAEASTASDTRKYSMTPHYAAPEQWRHEHATIAADMYALGIMAFEMLAGHRPFPGPAYEDFRQQHLHGDVPELSSAPAGLAALVDECLYKAAAARPTPANFRVRLDRVRDNANSGGGLAQLEEANQAEVRRRSEESRKRSEAMTEQERRAELLTTAQRSFGRISTAFREAIMGAAPSAVVSSSRDGGWGVRLGDATLTFSGINQRPDSNWGGWNPPTFDVIATATINLRIPPKWDYEGRSHSLWFGDIQEPGQYGWFECAFMISPFVPKRGRQNPFSLDPGEDSSKAVWAGMAEYQVAWPFTLLDTGDPDELIGRWANWLAQASKGELQMPGMMPERSVDGSWRTK